MGWLPLLLLGLVSFWVGVRFLCSLYYDGDTYIPLFFGDDFCGLVILPVSYELLLFYLRKKKEKLACG
jgi:hypothetical protein